MSDIRRKEGHPHADFKYVNRNHHASCFAGYDATDLTLDLPRHPPDPYTVPVTVRTIVKIKDDGIPKDSILKLCRTARVYFNSDRPAAFRRKFQKRLEDVSSPRRVKHTETKLIPLEGYESKVRRSRRARGRYSYPTEEDNDVVLPDINGTRKSDEELSPDDPDVAGSPHSRHRSSHRGSSKANNVQRSWEYGGSKGLRREKGNYHSNHGNRGTKHYKTSGRGSSSTVYGSRTDEKRFTSIRGDHSDDDYSDDE